MSDLIRREDVLAYLEGNTNNFPDYHEAIEQVLKIPNANKAELEEIKAEIDSATSYKYFVNICGKRCAMIPVNKVFEILDKRIKEIEE